MTTDFYRLSLDSYTALLASSGIFPNNLAAAYIEYTGDSLQTSLNEAETNGLYKDGSLTENGARLISIICSPERSVVTVNSSFGSVPLCVFSYKDNNWVFISVDYKLKSVTLLGLIENNNIISVVKDALIGNLVITNYSPFSITLNNDELYIYNLVLMLMGQRFKEKNGVLLPLDCRFKFEDIIDNREFAKQALAGEVLSENSDIFGFINDPERCRIAINKLIEKQILAKSSVFGYLQPGITMFYRLAPQKGMFILSYSNLETKIGHKYYVFPNSILEVTVDRSSLTFTAVKDIDYSPWNI